MNVMGKHVLLDLIVNDPKILETNEEVERRILHVYEKHVTILGVMTHDFGVGFGVSGVMLLKESHISWHSWPEKSYIALDIFTCGNFNPNDHLHEILEAFDVKSSYIRPYERGYL